MQGGSDTGSNANRAAGYRIGRCDREAYMCGIDCEGLNYDFRSYLYLEKSCKEF